jgi:hypothetical protein
MVSFAEQAADIMPPCAHTKKIGVFVADFIAN